MSFEEKGYEVVKGAVGSQTCELIATQFKMLEQAEKFCRGVPLDVTNRFDDDQVNNSFPWYGGYFSESLLLMLKPVVEKVTGKELYPCYSYARIMRKGAAMAKHKDRPSCQFSATITITEDKDNKYPIFMENYQGEASALYLAPGDMVVYNGTELNHWREEYVGREQIQIFIHYVDAKGPYADRIYDTRPMLGLSPEAKKS